MPPRDYQGNKGKRHRPILEENGADVSIEVVNTDQRPARAIGEGLRKTQSDKQCPHESWPLGDADKVDVPECRAGLFQRCIHHGADVLDVTSTGEFRNDAPIGSVDAVLRGNDVGKNLIAVRQDGGRRFVA